MQNTHNKREEKRESYLKFIVSEVETREKITSKNQKKNVNYQKQIRREKKIEKRKEEILRTNGHKKD